MKSLLPYGVVGAVLVWGACVAAGLAQGPEQEPAPGAGTETPRTVALGRGTIRSELSAEARWHGGPSGEAGAEIVKLAAEGSMVKEGDVLVQFACAEVEDQRLEAELLAAEAQTTLIEAECRLEAAKMALAEFQQGSYPVQLATAQAELAISQHKARWAQERIGRKAGEAEKEDAPGAAEPGEARYSLSRAETEMRLAELKLKVLQEFTKTRMDTELQGAIRIAQSALDCAGRRVAIGKVRLERSRQEAEKCLFKASAPGQVYYEGRVREGAHVRPDQVVLRVYDPKRVSLDCVVAASRTTDIVPGMEATVRLDALPDRPMRGRVEKVEKRERPTDRRLYNVIVRLVDPPADLRPGLTGEVRFAPAAAK